MTAPATAAAAPAAAAPTAAAAGAAAPAIVALGDAAVAASASAPPLETLLLVVQGLTIPAMLCMGSLPCAPCHAPLLLTVPPLPRPQSLLRLLFIRSIL